MLQAKVADMYTTLNLSRSYTYNVARSLDKGLIVSKVSTQPKSVIHIQCGQVTWQRTYNFYGEYLNWVFHTYTMWPGCLTEEKFIISKRWVLNLSLSYAYNMTKLLARGLTISEVSIQL